ncbi:MAG: hypothetical protein ABEJ07_05565 [Candidatus Nanohaloarchaea archaeon]
MVDDYYDTGESLDMVVERLQEELPPSRIDAAVADARKVSSLDPNSYIDSFSDNFRYWREADEVELVRGKM